MLTQLKVEVEEVEITTVKQALAIVGSLSRPSKMPGLAWGLSADLCKRGSRLAMVRGSVCSRCYAKKGNYRYPGVKLAHERRLAGLCHPQWTSAMVFLIRHYKEKYFRFMDSGDLQGEFHLAKIIEICNQCKSTKFWLPTRELAILRAWKKPLPKNLVIRASASMIDGDKPPGFANTSTVAGIDNKKRWPALVAGNTKAKHYCQAPLQEGKCLDCRACFSRASRDIMYLKH